MIGDLLVAEMLRFPIKRSFDGKHTHWTSADRHDARSHRAFFATEVVKRFCHLWVFCNQFLIIVDHLQVARYEDVLPIHIDAIHGIDEGDTRPSDIIEGFLHLLIGFSGSFRHVICATFLTKCQVHGDFCLVIIHDWVQCIILWSEWNRFTTGACFGTSYFIRQVHDALTIGSTFHIRPGQCEIEILRFVEVGFFRLLRHIESSPYAL